jgi:hypothetical protein
MLNLNPVVVGKLNKTAFDTKWCPGCFFKKLFCHGDFFIEMFGCHLWGSK